MSKQTKMMKVTKAIITAGILFFLFDTALAIQLTSRQYGSETIPNVQLQSGDLAPQAKLLDRHYQQVTIGGSSDKVQIIVTAESLYTPLSNDQITTLNANASKLNATVVYVVTANQPIIVNMFENTHKFNTIQFLSAFNNPAFGLSYGVQIIGGKLTGITVPAIFVVNHQGKIVYKEIAHKLDQKLNIQAAITAAENVEKNGGSTVIE
ncbi:MAG: redoxin family protein [Pseudomonadota bacterium]